MHITSNSLYSFKGSFTENTFIAYWFVLISVIYCYYLFCNVKKFILFSFTLQSIAVLNLLSLA